jgi:hypothetical protein
VDEELWVRSPFVAARAVAVAQLGQSAGCALTSSATGRLITHPQLLAMRSLGTSMRRPHRRHFHEFMRALYRKPTDGFLSPG